MIEARSRIPVSAEKMTYERGLTDAEEILAEEKRSRGTYIFIRRSKPRVKHITFFRLAYITCNPFDVSDDKLTVSLKNSSAQQRLGVALVKKFLHDVFLPRGYPSSVSSDYMDYQIWDTVQVKLYFQLYKRFYKPPSSCCMLLTGADLCSAVKFYLMGNSGQCII